MPPPRWRLRLVIPFLLVGLLYISTASYRLDVVVPNGTSAHPSSFPDRRGDQPTASTLREAATSKPARARGLEHCEDLPTHANFTSHGSAKLCYSSEQCIGTVRLHVPQCEKYKRPLSRNASHNQWILNKGADTFRLRVDGPETHAAMSEVDAAGDGPCHYVISIPRLSTAGTYVLGLEWLYSDYHALDEITNQWPFLKKVPVLPLDESFSTNYHLQQCTLPSTVTIDCSGGGSVVGTSSGSEWRERKGDTHAARGCSGFEQDTSGRWILHQDKPAVFTRVRVKKIQRNPIVFQWALQSDAYREWMPNSCSALRLSQKELLAGLRGKRVIVGGDSQLRALYFGLVNFLAGYGNECLRNISTVIAEPSHCVANVKGSHRKIINEVQIDFVDDLFLDRLGERYRSYDVVIVGFAQHPASKEHWSFDKYRSSFMSKVPRLEQLRQQGAASVIWYLAPQYPHTRHGYPVVVKDWRTDPRLLMFNEFTKAECLSRQFPVVDAFRISTAMSHTSPDQAHFTNFVSYELVTMVANVVCSQKGINCKTSV